MTEFDPFSTPTARHWCPQSQRYAGGDALLTCLHDGWSIQQEVDFEEFWHGGSRRMVVYYINLVRGDQRMTMPVIDNPVVSRIIAQSCLHVRPRSAFPTRQRQPLSIRRSFN